MRRLVVGVLGLSCVLAVGACRGKHGQGGSDPGGGADPEETLNNSLILPPGSYTLSNPPTDDSITVTGTPSDPGAPTTAGSMVNVGVQFSAPSANIVGAGIRIGMTGPVNVVPIAGAMGNASGNLAFQMGVPSDICGDLSSICHSIICYEFAVTSAGTISRANINSLALMCGNCDEPSCQELLTMCEEDPCAGQVVPTCSGGSPYCCTIISDTGECDVGPHCDTETCATYDEVPCRGS